MARCAYELLAPPARPGSGATPLWRAITGLGILYRCWRQRSRDRQSAAQLTERELHDMGLTRADIYRELYAWRRK